MTREREELDIEKGGCDSDKSTFDDVDLVSGGRGRVGRSRRERLETGQKDIFIFILGRVVYDIDTFGNKLNFKSLSKGRWERERK